MIFKRFTPDDYDAVCDFLIELNRGDNRHINWNWARFEWMYEHPEFDKSLIGSIGLWLDGGRVVGAAIYDMYLGEEFCAALPEYDELYTEILEYSKKELKDGSGLAIAICDDNTAEISAALRAGFAPTDQDETVMSIDLGGDLAAKLPDGLHITELDPAEEPEEFQWILWQGFDHGTDKEEFSREDPVVPQIRPHFDRRLSLTAVDARGEAASYCCLWYLPGVDYAYVEPVCTVPSYRGKGIAKALICEALNRARAQGAKKAYVISDTDLYRKLGFKEELHYTFYRKEEK